MLLEKDIIESSEVREKLINNLNALDKIKAVPYFSKDLTVGIKQAAYYYDVNYETIKGVIKRHRDEFNQDGLIVLTGKELADYKLKNVYCEELNEPYIGNKSRKFTLIPKRALLRLGMILTKSNVASLLRTYLINLEENSSLEVKQISLLNTIDDQLKEKSIISMKEINYNLKKENAIIKSNLNKLEMYGFDKMEASLIIQKAKINNKDYDEAILDAIYNTIADEKTKIRNRIRLKIEKIALDFYKGNPQEIYHTLSEKLKYIVGIDMKRIRDRSKNKYGKYSTHVPSYLDLIIDNKIEKEAETVLENIYEESRLNAL